MGAVRSAEVAHLLLPRHVTTKEANEIALFEVDAGEEAAARGPHGGDGDEDVAVGERAQVGELGGEVWPVAMIVGLAYEIANLRLVQELDGVLAGLVIIRFCRRSRR